MRAQVVSNYLELSRPNLNYRLAIAIMALPLGKQWLLLCLLSHMKVNNSVPIFELTDNEQFL